MGALPQPANRMAGTMVAPAKQFLRLKVLFISELPLAIAPVATSISPFDFSPGLAVFIS